MYKINEIKEKKIWENFLEDKKIVYYPFFQSWSWGEVQKKLGHIVDRVGVFDGKDLVAICQITDVVARRGHYIHLRHGPVLKPFSLSVLDFLLDYIKKIARGKDASFIRLSPLVEKSLVGQESLKNRNMIPAPIPNMDAEICWMLNIENSEEDLLKNMRKSHRYLVKKALGDKDLKVIKTTNGKDMEKFVPLYKNLSLRKHFVPHKGVEEEFEEFKKDNQSLLILIEYLPAGRQGKKKIIAGGLFDFVGNMAIYRHSASDDEYRAIPAMYLLLWEAILEAKRRGLTVFNFWGVTTEKDSPRHPWQGLSLFKTGFGGERKEFLHAQDIPLSSLYWKTYAIETASKFLKGY